MSLDRATWEDDMPDAYDRCLGPVMLVPFAERLADRAAAGDATRILEIAAGTGIVTNSLLEHLPDAEVVATDLNPAMVEYGRERAPGADWQTADANTLPFTDGEFDLVACGFGVMFLGERTPAYREISRVLGDSGRFIFTTWDSLDRCAMPNALEHSLETILPDDTPDFLTRLPHSYTDPDRIRHDLTESGFDVLAVDRTSITSHSSSARNVAEGYCFGSPLRFQLRDRGDLPDLFEAIAGQMTAELGEGQITEELTALVVEARMTA